MRATTICIALISLLVFTANASDKEYLDREIVFSQNDNEVRIEIPLASSRRVYKERAFLQAVARLQKAINELRKQGIIAHSDELQTESKIQIEYEKIDEKIKEIITDESFNAEWRKKWKSGGNYSTYDADAVAAKAGVTGVYIVVNMKKSSVATKNGTRRQAEYAAEITKTIGQGVAAPAATIVKKGLNFGGGGKIGVVVIPTIYYIIKKRGRDEGLLNLKKDGSPLSERMLKTILSTNKMDTSDLIVEEHIGIDANIVAMVYASGGLGIELRNLNKFMPIFGTLHGDIRYTSEFDGRFYGLSGNASVQIPELRKRFPKLYKLPRTNNWKWACVDNPLLSERGALDICDFRFTSVRFEKTKAKFRHKGIGKYVRLELGGRGNAGLIYSGTAALEFLLSGIKSPPETRSRLLHSLKNALKGPRKSNDPVRIVAEGRERDLILESALRQLQVRKE